MAMVVPMTGRLLLFTTRRGQQIGTVPGMVPPRPGAPSKRQRRLAGVACPDREGALNILASGSS